MYFHYEYVVDWHKVKTIEDIVRILEVANIRFEPSHPGLDKIEYMLARRTKDDGMVCD